MQPAKMSIKGTITRWYTYISAYYDVLDPHKWLVKGTGPQSSICFVVLDPICVYHKTSHHCFWPDSEPPARLVAKYLE